MIKTGTDWYKSANIYVVYPDAFKDGDPGNFLTLSKNLTYISSMGFNAIHVLPFLKSPMLDGGFDVSDYTKVRKKLGGNEGLDGFLKKAKRLKLRIFMDLVINHVSFKHDWFQKALKGDSYYRNFFIHSTKKPRLLKVAEDKKGKWATYRLGRRNLRSRIIFYSNDKVLPHWIEGGDGFWYYHTFYPHQIDLNWTNPEVYKAFFRIIEFWGKKGLNFRIDAAPFAGKKLTGILEEGSHESHEIVRKLHRFCKSVNEDSVFLVEACQPIAKTRKYFGSGKSKESELAYNFGIMRALWSSLLTSEPVHIWRAVTKTDHIPKHAQWVTFLRNHDELSLEYANPKQRSLIYKSLLKDGVGFRGEFGLAGRTASFLHNDAKRIILAHFLLASINGVPAVVYGDEIGKGTDKRSLRIDPRDVNRGHITKHTLEGLRARRISRQLAKIFTCRLKFGEVAFVDAKRIFKHHKSIFAASYRLNGKKLTVIANLSSKKKVIGLPNGGKIKCVLGVNGGKIKNNSALLPTHAGVWLTS